jgi:hypothetical protein
VLWPEGPGASPGAAAEIVAAPASVTTARIHVALPAGAASAPSVDVGFVLTEPASGRAVRHESVFVTAGP